MKRGRLECYMLTLTCRYNPSENWWVPDAPYMDDRLQFTIDVGKYSNSQWRQLCWVQPVQPLNSPRRNRNVLAKENSASHAPSIRAMAGTFRRVWCNRFSCNDAGRDAGMMMIGLATSSDPKPFSGAGFSETTLKVVSLVRREFRTPKNGRKNSGFPGFISTKNAHKWWISPGDFSEVKVTELDPDLPGWEVTF